jgi:hypothetical protein
MVEQQQQWPVAVLCEVLVVRRSGFYTSLQRPATARREAKARRLMQQAAVPVQRRQKRYPVTTDSWQRYGGTVTLAGADRL